MREALLHGLAAGLLACGLTLLAGLLPIGVRASRADAGAIGLIVFCVAFGHTRGIAAGHALAGLAAGAVTGLVLAAGARTMLARR